MGVHLVHLLRDGAVVVVVVDVGVLLEPLGSVVTEDLVFHGLRHVEVFVVTARELLPVGVQDLAIGSDAVTQGIVRDPAVAAECPSVTVQSSKKDFGIGTNNVELRFKNFVSPHGHTSVEIFDYVLMSLT